MDDMDDFISFVGLQGQPEPRILRALSLRQPWADAVIYGGKRIENRTKWRNSSFRGHVLIHAAAGMTAAENDAAIKFMGDRGITWRPDPASWLRRGGFVGEAHVVGVVRDQADVAACPAEQAAWWMGGFGLLLEDVRPLPFVEWKGMLGFFRVNLDAVLAAVPDTDKRSTWARVAPV